MKTPTTNTNSKLFFLLCFATILIFSFDLLTPRGINEANLYLIPILFSIRITGKSSTNFLSITAIVLIFLGFYFSPEGGLFKISIINRLYDALGIFLTWYIILKYKEKEKIIKQQNAELEKSLINLSYTNSNLEQFAYVASHDLQEPLRLIKRFSQLIIKSEKFSDKTQNYFNIIIATSERMQNLIVSLIDYSRIDKTELNFVPCNLDTIVDESKSNLKLSISEKQAIVENENLPTINGLYVQLSQLFTNLISNAIEYCRPEVIPHIKITSERICGSEISHPAAINQLEYYAIKIADNGIGFEKEYATKIFDAFKRLHTGSEFAGTGIGLSIVKKIITQHNGFIVAEGIPDVGSTFTLYIPTA